MVGVPEWSQRKLGSSQFISFEGCSTTVSFWSALWCGDRPLKEVFPQLFCIACNKEAFVVDHLIFWNDTIHWTMNFIHTVQDWELESITSFLDLLYSTSMKGFGTNK